MRKKSFRILLIAAGIPLSLALAGFIFLKWYFSMPAAGPGDGAYSVFYNGNIITMDESRPVVSAIVVKNGRITYAGDRQGALKEAEEGMPAYDLAGRTVVPGFNDDHVHALAAGAFYSELVLHGKSCADIAKAVKAAVSKARPGEPISGNSWDYTTCPDPHRSMLDAAAPSNPVFLVQYSGHAAWVNSAMLKDMGIDGNTPDPKGGQILRDSKGEPTGILRDTAMGSSGYGKFIKRILSPRLHRATLDKTLKLCAASGITSIQDNTWEPFTVRLYGRLRAEGALSVRTTCWPQGSSFLESLFDGLAYFHPGDTWIRSGAVKYFADGAFSTRTAWLYEPYADETKNSGAPRWSDAEMEALVMAAAASRRQLAVHAIGDRAATQVIDAVEKAAKRYPRVTGLRFRLEHVQILRPSDIARMKKLGMVASVQPFALCNPAKDVKLLGAERARRAYPYKSLLKEGIPLALGSDMPAEVDYRPMLNVYYAVTRKSADGKQGPLNPAETLSVYEALRAYTRGSAYAEFMEKEKGVLAGGKLADFVVLDRDPFSSPAGSLKDIMVVMTVVGGKIVYSRP